MEDIFSFTASYVTARWNHIGEGYERMYRRTR